MEYCLNDFHADLLLGIGADVNHYNIEIINSAFKAEYNLFKLREIYKGLQERYSKSQYDNSRWNTMTKEEVINELGISKNQLKKMIDDGLAPQYCRTSAGSKSSYRFFMISVAEFMC